MLRVGIIGLGIGEQHVIGYRRNPHCEVASICDFNPQKLSEVSSRYPGVRTNSNSDELLDDPEIDLISIASHDDDHCEQICRAFRNGKHVFVEKPLCQSLAQLKSFQSAWEAQGRRLKIKSNLVLRAAPLYVWARNQIASGKLGDVYSFDGDYLYGRLSKITNGWRTKTDEYSVMAGGGVHLIDLMIWLTQQRPQTIQTVGNRACANGSAFRYNDYAASTMTFDSGMLARVSANFGCVHGHQHVVRIFGTQGTLLYDDQGPRFQSHRDPAPPAEVLSESPLPTSKHVLIDDFVSAIIEDEDLRSETQFDFDVMSVCIASDESLAKATSIKIQYA